MSASDEWWEWHLTPRGWIEGDEKLDHQPRVQRVEPPVDRVLTVCVHDYWPSVYRRQHWVTEEFRSADADVVNRLIEQYGAKA